MVWAAIATAAASAYSANRKADGGGGGEAAPPAPFYGGDMGPITNNFGPPPPMPGAPILRGGSTVTGFDYAAIGLVFVGVVGYLLVRKKGK